VPACLHVPPLAVIDYHCRWLDKLLSLVMSIVQVLLSTSWLCAERLAPLCFSRTPVARSVCVTQRDIAVEHLHATAQGIDDWTPTFETATGQSADGDAGETGGDEQATAFPCLLSTSCRRVMSP